MPPYKSKPDCDVRINELERRVEELENSLHRLFKPTKNSQSAKTKKQAMMNELVEQFGRRKTRLA